MKATIAQDGCIGCGLCTDICISVFKMADNAYAEVYVDEVPAEDIKDAEEAMENCPVLVISLEE